MLFEGDVVLFDATCFDCEPALDCELMAPDWGAEDGAAAAATSGNDVKVTMHTSFVKGFMALPFSRTSGG